MIGKVKAEIELMKRHMEVMQAVVSNQPIGIMKLSELLDQPFHRVRYSLRVLEHLGYRRHLLPARLLRKRARTSLMAWTPSLTK